MSAEERNRYIKKLSITVGFGFLMIVLFILTTVAAPNTIQPVVLDFPLYVFWEAIIIPILAYAAVTYWFKKMVKFDREVLEKEKELWR